DRRQRTARWPGQDRSVLLGRVVRREQSFSFLFAQALAGIGEVDPDDASISTSDDPQRATLWHGVDRIQKQILDGAPQLFSIAPYGAERGIEVERQCDRRMPGRGELCAKQRRTLFDNRVDRYLCKLGRRHFREVAEPPDDSIQVAESGLQRCQALVED